MVATLDLGRRIYTKIGMFQMQPKLAPSVPVCRNKVKEVNQVNELFVNELNELNEQDELLRENASKKHKSTQFTDQAVRATR